MYIIDKKGLSKKYFGSIYLRLISNLKNEELLFGQPLLFYLIFSNQGNLSSGASTSIVFGPRNFLPVSSLHCPLGNITLRVCSYQIFISQHKLVFTIHESLMGERIFHMAENRLTCLCGPAGLFQDITTHFLM